MLDAWWQLMSADIKREVVAVVLQRVPEVNRSAS
jgi:hypothetical protein